MDLHENRHDYHIISRSTNYPRCNSAQMTSQQEKKDTSDVVLPSKLQHFVIEFLFLSSESFTLPNRVRSYYNLEPFKDEKMS